MVRNTVMGIDQSLTHTGVCVLNKNNMTIVHLETIETDNSLDDTDRCTIIAEKIIHIVYKFHVTEINIESYAYAVRGNYSYRAGELGGIIKYLIRKIVVPFNTAHIQAHKKQFTGKGNTNKKEMIEFVKSKYDLEVNEHEADAISIANYKNET